MENIYILFTTGMPREFKHVSEITYQEGFIRFKYVQDGKTETAHYDMDNIYKMEVR